MKTSEVSVSMPISGRKCIRGITSVLKPSGKNGIRSKHFDRKLLMRIEIPSNQSDFEEQKS